MIIAGLSLFHTSLQILKMNEKKKINFKTLVILSLFFIPFGCSKIVEQTGVPTNDEIFSKLMLENQLKAKSEKYLVSLWSLMIS